LSSEFQLIILPGFHDVHQHPLESGSEIGATCRLPINAAPDSELMKETLEKCALTKPQKGMLSEHDCIKGFFWFLL
jgi:hypothetical protein